MTFTSSQSTKAVQVSEAATAKIAITSLHELNNKLGIILAHCDLLSTKAAADSKTARHLGAIRDAADAMTRILARLVNL